MTPWVIGLHVLSLHNPNCYQDDARQCVAYNKQTTGIYARAPSGFSFGGYTNSYGHPSAYAGWTWHTPNGRFALTAALVTGYPAKPLRVLAMPSVRFDLPHDWTLRLVGGPRVEKQGAAVLHIALERPF